MLIGDLGLWFGRNWNFRPCTWSGLQNGTFVAGCPDGGCKSFHTASAAKAACSSTHDCKGITYTDGKLDGSGAYSFRFLHQL